MTDDRNDLFERLKPIWEAVVKLGENAPELSKRAYLNELRGEVDNARTASLRVENGPDRRDEKVAEDPEAQFKMIAVAYATGDMDEVDQMINYLAFIRRMKKQGIYELGHWSDEDSDGR